MASRKAAGPIDRTRDRGPREIEQLPGRLDETNTADQVARQAVKDLIANGADLHFRPANGSLPASFTHELRAGGDRQRCRQIVAETKGRPMVWAALLKEIAMRSGGVA